MPHPDAAALSSVQSDLDQIIARIVTIADARRDDTDDLLTPQLDELERALVSANRRLERALRTL